MDAVFAAAVTAVLCNGDVSFLSFNLHIVIHFIDKREKENIAHICTHTENVMKMMKMADKIYGINTLAHNESRKNERWSELLLLSSSLVWLN